MATEAIIKFIFKEEIGSVFEKMASYDEGGLGSLLAVVMSIDQGAVLISSFHIPTLTSNLWTFEH